ncbi:MAG TPA: histidine kinase [Gammaproteobacteria bacterium]|nr:histidine kinase [Gammaproteobacteria bacterium]
MIVVAVPFWTYITLARVVAMYAWQIGESGDVIYGQSNVRIAQHAIIMLLSIPLYTLALKTGFPAGRRWSAGAIQLLLALALALLARPSFIVAWLIFMPDSGPVLVSPMEHPGVWLGTTMDYLSFYGFGLALVFGTAIYLELRDEKLRAARLQNESMRATLHALRMQLNPHFLFNTLHTVTALIGRQPKVASDMLVRLSELLRRVLSDGGEDQVPLEREMAFINSYLEIEALRFEDRMTVTVDIDPAARDALVPSLILQPIVENAVKHGTANDENDVEISVAARRDGHWLELTVRNSAAGAAAGGDGRGIGLENTRARLRMMFGDRQRVDAGHLPAGEFIARLRFPYVFGGSDAGEGQACPSAR